MQNVDIMNSCWLPLTNDQVPLRLCNKLRFIRLLTVRAQHGASSENSHKQIKQAAGTIHTQHLEKIMQIKETKPQGAADLFTHFFEHMHCFLFLFVSLLSSRQEYRSHSVALYVILESNTYRRGKKVEEEYIEC